MYRDFDDELTQPFDGDTLPYCKPTLDEILDDLFDEPPVVQFVRLDAVPSKGRAADCTAARKTIPARRR
jgi:hypothetical protein